jgi:hypothetical protein
MAVSAELVAGCGAVHPLLDAHQQEIGFFQSPLGHTAGRNPEMFRVGAHRKIPGAAAHPAARVEVCYFTRRR